jgi:hypothetical protein
MILDRTLVGRYAFVFDINSGRPFPQLPDWDISPNPGVWTIDETQTISLNAEYPDTNMVGKFVEMEAWLRERTSAFQIYSVTISTDVKDTDINLKLSAILIEVEMALAPIFKLYWYGRRDSN